MLDITKCISLGHLANDHEMYSDWKEAVIFFLPKNMLSSAMNMRKYVFLRIAN